MGGLGASLRYLCYYIGQQTLMLPNYVETIIVNWIGSFILSYTATRTIFTKNWVQKHKQLIISGFFGSFTTFSMLIYDAEQFYEQNALFHELGYIMLNVFGGYLGVLFGLQLAQKDKDEINSELTIKNSEVLVSNPIADMEDKY
jgi:CrcB protein